VYIVYLFLISPIPRKVISVHVAILHRWHSIDNWNPLVLSANPRTGMAW